MSEFVDYYELLQISPNAEVAAIQRVYRMLAIRFHPDNHETGDMDKFLILQKAHQVLSDPQLRAAYDAEHQRYYSRSLPEFGMKEFVNDLDSELNKRLGVLCLLYNRRKQAPNRPGLSVWDMETLTAFPREHLEFTLWYLFEKRYIRPSDHSSDYLITSEGVDFVEQHLPSSRVVYKLLKQPEGDGAAADGNGSGNGRV